MAIRASSSLPQNTETQSIESDKCWSWSIQPIVIWIRILGVDLPGICSTPRPLRNRRLMSLYAFFCFAANLLGQIDILNYLHVKRMESKLALAPSTVTATWNFIIDFCNYAINGVGAHILFLVVIRQRWNELMQIFQKSEVFFQLECFRRIRNLSFLMMAYVIFVVSQSHIFIKRYFISYSRSDY